MAMSLMYSDRAILALRQPRPTSVTMFRSVFVSLVLLADGEAKTVPFVPATMP